LQFFKKFSKSVKIWKILVVFLLISFSVAIGIYSLFVENRWPTEKTDISYQFLKNLPYWLNFGVFFFLIPIIFFFLAMKLIVPILGEDRKKKKIFTYRFNFFESLTKFLLTIIFLPLNNLICYYK
jgi:hypothetical protein